MLDGFLKNFIDGDEDEVKQPIFGFRTVSACSVWTYLCAPHLIEDGQLPIRGTLSSYLCFKF